MLKQGDIIWVDFSPTKGHEQAGRRPALIVSADVFNQETGGIVWAVPITSKINGYGKLTVPEELPISGVFILSQIRALDTNARNFEVICSVPDDIMDDIIGRLCAVLMG